MRTIKTFFTTIAVLLCACDSATDPVAPSPASAQLDRDQEAASGGGAVFTGSALALNATVNATSQKFCDSGPVAKTGGRNHVNLASASITGVLSATQLYCHAGGVDNRGYAEGGLRNLVLTVGGITIAADVVHAMVGSFCPPSGSPGSRGHTAITRLKVNDRVVTVSGAVGQKISLPNGFIVINEQTSFVTPFHAGRTVIALHVVVNGSESSKKERKAESDRRSNAAADIVIGRVQTHIDCP